MAQTWSPEAKRWQPPDAIAFVSPDSRGGSGISRLLKRAVGEVAVVESLQDLASVSDFALTREAMALSALEHALVARSEAQAVSWRRAAATVPDASIHDWIAPL